MATVNADSVLNFIQTAYQTIDRLNLSIEMLAVIALVTTIAFLFALREVTAWFFKIDDLRRDIRSLETGISRLEAEIKALQAKDPATGTFGIAAEPSSSHLRRVEQFPINH